MAASTGDVGRDEAAAAALTALGVVRRALIEGVPVTRETLGREASFVLEASPMDALRELDATAQRLGLGSLL
ncbi:MAG TPA: hypothetical protein VGY97_12180 [Solirubrobacteraceae bacterium]|nr:hypothetical protein [Solirubrobacteraceae bacterium]